MGFLCSSHCVPVIVNDTASCEQGYHFSGKTGNLTEFDIRQRNVGKFAIGCGIVGKRYCRKNCSLLTWFLGLCWYLVASRIHVLSTVRCDMGSHNLGSSAVNSPGNIRKFCSAYWFIEQGLTSHIIGHIGDDFYRSYDQTNNVKALKETKESCHFVQRRLNCIGNLCIMGRHYKRIGHTCYRCWPVSCRPTNELLLKWKNWQELESAVQLKCVLSSVTMCVMFCSPAGRHLRNSTLGTGRQIKPSEIVYIQLECRLGTLPCCFSSICLLSCCAICVTRFWLLLLMRVLGYFYV